MKDCIKCCMFSLGVGFVMGAMITANNKKLAMSMRDVKNMAMEKIEEAKEGIEKIKENIVESVEEKNNSQNNENYSVKNKSKASK